MNYTAKIRSRSGAVEVVDIEAADRESAIRELKSRGATPLSIVEGRSPNARKPGQRRNIKTAVLVGTALVVAALAAWLLLKPSAEPKEVPSGTERAQTKHASKPTERPASERTPKNDEGAVATQTVAVSSAPTNTWPKIEKLPNGREIHTNEDGTRVLVLNPIDPEAEAERLRNLPPPMFKHEVESALDMYVEPGIEMPPLPRDYTNEEVLQALMEPIEIDPEKDDEEAQLHKKTVQQFKEELKEYIKNGGTFAEYMRKLADRQSKEAQMIQESRRMVMKTLDEGKTEEAQQLLDALNKHLSDQGIPSVKMPPPYRKILEGAKKK